MKLKRLASSCYAGMMMVLAGVMLIGCKSNQATLAATSQDVGSTYTSRTFTTSYTSALNAANQLMLGMLRLEGTENAITPEQASVLLPVVQSLQGQALKSDAERNAVLAYVEAQLTPAQSSAIASMRLTQDDLQTWTRDNRGGRGVGPGQGGAGPQGTPGARPGQGGARPQGTPGSPPSSGGIAGAAGAETGQSNILLNALIRLLASKSARVATPAITLAPSGIA